MSNSRHNGRFASHGSVEAGALLTMSRGARPSDQRAPCRHCCGQVVWVLETPSRNSCGTNALSPKMTCLIGRRRHRWATPCGTSRVTHQPASVWLDCEILYVCWSTVELYVFVTAETLPCGEESLTIRMSRAEPPQKRSRGTVCRAEPPSWRGEVRKKLPWFVRVAASPLSAIALGSRPWPN